MTRTLRVLRILAALGVVATVAGILMILGQSLAETVADPSLTVWDGYWIGRLPLMGIGPALVVVGANVALVAGVAASLMAGGGVRRGLVLIAAAAGVAWWLISLLTAVSGAGCPTCLPATSDPFTTAYSLPDATLLLLVLPAALAAVLGLLPRRPRA